MAKEQLKLKEQELEPMKEEYSQESAFLAAKITKNFKLCEVAFWQTNFLQRSRML